MYFLVDCDNFFVSCERNFQPNLRGVPIIVLSNNDKCVVARSNEAKVKICGGVSHSFFPVEDLPSNVTFMDNLVKVSIKYSLNS